MSQIVLYCLHSTSVLLFYKDVVLTLSTIDGDESVSHSLMAMFLCGAPDIKVAPYHTIRLPFLVSTQLCVGKPLDTGCHWGWWRLWWWNVWCRVGRFALLSSLAMRLYRRSCILANEIQWFTALKFWVRIRANCWCTWLGVVYLPQVLTN